MQGREFTLPQFFCFLFGQVLPKCGIICYNKRDFDNKRVPVMKAVITVIGHTIPWVLLPREVPCVPAEHQH